MPRESQPKEILSLQELCKFLRIGPNKVIPLLESGAIPGRKMGTRWRIHREEAINWLRTGKGIAS